MSIFLDSAVIAEAQAASRLEWVAGITTNPILLAKSGLPAVETLRTLAHLTNGPVFYQLMSGSVGEMMTEAQRAKDLLGDQLVLKMPPTEACFTVAAEISSSIPVCITAVYSAAQAMVAEAAGARYIALYFNRARRLLPDADSMVRAICACLQGSKTEPIAASIKSPEEAVQVRLLGVPHLTLPFTVLTAMMDHELSRSALDEFIANGTGIL